MPTERELRLQSIRQILSRDEVTNQVELVRALENQGFSTTQSVVSRDLRDLAVAKVSGRYRLSPERSVTGELEAMPGFVLGVQTAGPNLLVVQTVMGGANRVALAIDRAGWPSVAGTVAGNDTVFVALNEATPQAEIEGRIRRLAPNS